MCCLQKKRKRLRFDALRARQIRGRASSPLPLGRFERRLRAFGVAARIARMRDKAPIFGSQSVVTPRPGVGARRGALDLRVVALLQPHARELLPQARIARLDAKRPLEGRRSVGQAPGRGIGARPVNQAGDRQVLGAGTGMGAPGSGCLTVAQLATTTASNARRVLIGLLFSANCFYLPNRRCIQLFACCFTPSTAAPRADAQGARSTGAEPCANGSSTAPGQAKSARNPLSGSISTFSMPSGLGSASGSGFSAAIISPHTGSAAPAPESRAARLSS